VKVVVTGSHGLIGAALTARLADAGHEVRRLVRSAARPGEVHWDPGAGSIESGALEGSDAVVHLAGAGIGDHRWGAAYKARIVDSRLDGTRLLATAIAGLARPPRVLVSASAIGYYGDRGDEVLTEESGPGRGFLADLCQRWEEATEAASAVGVRVVHARNGIVLSGRGGSLRRQLPLFRLGIGGRLGHGRQFWSWIALADELEAIEFCLRSDDIAGPVNMTAPHPVTNAEFTRALGRAVRRPAILPVPGAALELGLGREFARELLLASARVLPEKLEHTGYRFTLPDVDAALRASIG
jgi:uncharacterized protein (TIGR01777 family)